MTGIPALRVGDRVKLLHGAHDKERFWWKVRAGDERYTILTRQRNFKPKGRLFYTIIDRQRNLRGPCNLIGQGYDVEAPGGCERLLADLQSGAVEVSYRNNIKVDFAEFDIKEVSDGAAA